LGGGRDGATVGQRFDDFDLLRGESFVHGFLIFLIGV
jgi:hypothetical protein